MILKLQYLKKIWKGFNWWRKKYCFTRVLILLLLFSPLIYERFSGSWIICDLVKIACDGIFMSSIPQSENALCKFYKFQEKRRLQLSIIAYADKNRNKILDGEEIILLREKGCDVDAILTDPMDLNLNKLAKNASLLDLLPPSYSTTEIREKWDRYILLSYNMVFLSFVSYNKLVLYIRDDQSIYSIKCQETCQEYIDLCLSHFSCVYFMYNNLDN